MSEQLPKEQMVSLEELQISHSYEIVALVTNLEKKGILTSHEVIGKILELHKGRGES